MTKWILMGAVVAFGSLFVEPAAAQEQIRPAGTVITSGQPTTQQRSGILGRLRNRRATPTTISEPMLVQPAATAQTPPVTTQTPPVTVQPSTTTTTPMATTQMQVVETRRGLFGRSRPTRQMVTVEPPTATTTTKTTPSVTQAQASTTPMATTTTVPVNEGRQGLFSRLRGRLGR